MNLDNLITGYGLDDGLASC